MSDELADDDALVKATVNLTFELSKVLASQHPFVQGAALAKVLAMWLCGNPDFLRQEILDQHIEYVRGLLPRTEAVLYDGKGHPNNRGTVQ